MPKTIISNIHWDIIIKRIVEGKCIPFLGMGVNENHDGYVGLSQNNEVAITLLRKLISSGEVTPEELVQVPTYEPLDKHKELIHNRFQDLARVAMHLESEGDTAYLIDLLQQLRPDLDREPSLVLNNLAQLPFRLIISTNHDHLMERALNWKCVPITQPLKGFDSQDQSFWQNVLEKHDPEKHGPIVYKIHGSFRKGGSEQTLPLTYGGVGAPVLSEGKRGQLLNLMDNLLNQEELCTLCFNLRVDYDNLPGTTKIGKARELILLLERNGHLHRLRTEFQEMHQNINWEAFPELVVEESPIYAPGMPQPVIDDHIIVTEQDFLQFLTIIGRTDGPGVPEMIKSDIIHKTRLFIGFDLSDWDFRTMYMMIDQIPRPRHLRNQKMLSFAIQKEPSEFWASIWEKKNIVVYNVDPYDFTGELLERYLAHGSN